MSELPIRQIVLDAEDVWKLGAGTLDNPPRPDLLGDVACHVYALVAEVERLEADRDQQRKYADTGVAVDDARRVEIADLRVEVEKLRAERVVLLDDALTVFRGRYPHFSRAEVGRKFRAHIKARSKP